MHESPLSRLLVVAGLAGAVLVSCGKEKPAPPPEAASAPPGSLRPLTSRDHGAPPPETSAAPTAEASLPPGHPPLDSAPHAAAGGAPDSGGAVAGTVTVAPKLQDRSAGGILFVIARAGADRHIVAVRREEAASFPFKFRISGADAMTAGTAFAGPLEITARLSKSGDAVPAKGDVEGVAKNVAVGATDVKVTLDTVRE